MMSLRLPAGPETSAMVVHQAVRTLVRVRRVSVLASRSHVSHRLLGGVLGFSTRFGLRLNVWRWSGAVYVERLDRVVAADPLWTAHVVAE